MSGALFLLQILAFAAVAWWAYQREIGTGPTETGLLGMTGEPPRRPPPKWTQSQDDEAPGRGPAPPKWKSAGEGRFGRRGR